MRHRGKRAKEHRQDEKTKQISTPEKKLKVHKQSSTPEKGWLMDGDVHPPPISGFYMWDTEKTQLAFSTIDVGKAFHKLDAPNLVLVRARREVLETSDLKSRVTSRYTFFETRHRERQSATTTPSCAQCSVCG